MTGQALFSVIHELIALLRLDGSEAFLLLFAQCSCTYGASIILYDMATHTYETNGRYCDDNKVYEKGRRGLHNTNILVPAVLLEITMDK